MTSISKKERKDTTLRMDKRMAEDLNILAKVTGRSKNDIIFKAIKTCLYENRRYFIREMVQELLFHPMEHDVIVMKENSNMKFGLITINLEKAENAEIYNAYLSVMNRQNELIEEDSRQIKIQTKEWEEYKTFVFEKFSQHIDLEDEGLKRYFYEKFSYE